MPSHRKKIVKVDAVQWDGSEEAVKAIQSMRLHIRVAESTGLLQILVKGRTYLVAVGDWVVESPTGNIRICTSGRFATEYELLPGSEKG